MSATVWPPLGIWSETAHPYQFDGRYGCEVCYASMHCPHCGDKCGSQGHAMTDADGFFLSCQEHERRDRWRDKITRAPSPASGRSRAAAVPDTAVAQPLVTPPSGVGRAAAVRDQGGA